MGEFGRTVAAAGVVLFGIVALDAGLPRPVNVVVTAAEAAAGVRNPSTLCFWENVDWDQMTPLEQREWSLLGWSATLWENGGSSSADRSDWADLTPEQRAAAKALGYGSVSWDGSDSRPCAGPYANNGPGAN
jgi:hypothetical protein